MNYGILAESLHLSIPAHQNRLIASNRQPTTFNNLSTLHSIGILYYIYCTINYSSTNMI